jgi:hypothetical protein
MFYLLVRFFEKALTATFANKTAFFPFPGAHDRALRPAIGAPCFSGMAGCMLMVRP